MKFIAIISFIVILSLSKQVTTYGQPNVDAAINQTAQDYRVGFMDTIIYNDTYTFDEYGYAGPAPLFLQIWHPIQRTSEGRRLSAKDLRTRTLPPKLDNVFSALCNKMDTAAVWYNISTKLGGDSITYGSNTSYFDVLDKAQAAPTEAIAARLIPKSNFPVVVYHHGAQGYSDENIDLAEHLAANGYIVVSSNFHLPYEEMVYGSSNHDIPQSLSLITSVLNFSNSLTTSKLFYIGHSMGAQKGLVHLINQNSLSAFVSLETTLEFVDTSEVQNIWPYLDSVFQTSKYKINIPTLMISNTGKDEPFHYFIPLAKNKMYHLIPKTPMDHESYTSANFQRLLVRESYRSPDISELESQQRTYKKILNYITTFFDSIQKKQEFKHEPIKKDFFVHEVKN